MHAVQDQKSHPLFGRLTKEEFEYIVKFQKFEQIQHYEQLIHECATDPEIYGHKYFQQSNNQLKLEHNLKMKPFSPQKQYVDKHVTKETYFTRKVYREVFEVLDVYVGMKFTESLVWDMEQLVNEISRATLSINFSKLDRQDIYLAVLRHENISVVGSYVVKISQSLDIDWFIFQKNTV